MVLALVLALIAAADPPSPFAFSEPVRPPRPVQAMAHRGLWRAAPENSRPALEACIESGIEWAEVDVRLTRDGKHILLHGDRLEGVTDGVGSVRETDLAEIVRLDLGGFAPRFRGTPPLTLESAFAIAKGRLNLYLDCKEVDPERLVEEIRSSGMERGVVVYGGPDLLRSIARAAGEGSAIPLMTKFRPRTQSIAELATIRGLVAVEIDADEITPAVVAEARKRGWIVQAKVLGAKWDDEATWGRVVDVGAQWIQTDWPVELHAFLVNRRGARRPIQFCCHRGASRQAPENTLASIAAALAVGADFIELDVRTTRDGRLVLMHDSDLRRTTDGLGLVGAISFDDLRKLDAGAWFGSLYRGARVPELAEALAAFRGRARFYCDAKDVAPEALRDALRAAGIAESTLVYGGVDFLARLREVAPEIGRMPPLSRVEDVDALAERLAPRAFDVRWTALSTELAAKCRSRGIMVFSDALGLHESVAEYRKAIDLGVDLIQTDRPERVLRAIELHAADSSRAGSRPGSVPRSP
ncbi:MAG: glycerophosphodiester phosphodiesterase family protein [Isosphaeraceae bacterium]|nr:glycerophosphodiester phosphodiesterase family protein [Isosphaeraceae bacterium]